MASLSLFRQPSTSSLLPSLARAFSTTQPVCVHSSSKKDRFELKYPDVPPYPYGPSLIYGQSNFGLYGTKKIRFGNSVSEKNEIKNRRQWKPNVQRKNLYSDALEKELKIRLTTSVLRTIKKEGGLDNYLLGEKAARIKELGVEGWRLRWEIMQTRAVRERYRIQRKEMKLEPVTTEVVLEDGRVTTQEKLDAEYELAKKREEKEKTLIKRALRRKRLGKDWESQVESDLNEKETDGDVVEETEWRKVDLE